jgi:hypothetical protein
MRAHQTRIMQLSDSVRHHVAAVLSEGASMSHAASLSWMLLDDYLIGPDIAYWVIVDAEGWVNGFDFWAVPLGEAGRTPTDVIVVERSFNTSPNALLASITRHWLSDYPDNSVLFEDWLSLPGDRFLESDPAKLVFINDRVHRLIGSHDLDEQVICNVIGRSHAWETVGCCARWSISDPGDAVLTGSVDDLQQVVTHATWIVVSSFDGVGMIIASKSEVFQSWMTARFWPSNSHSP